MSNKFLTFNFILVSVKTISVAQVSRESVKSISRLDNHRVVDIGCGVGVGGCS